MSFTARRITLSYGGDAPLRKRVYSRDEIGRLRDIAAVVERARRTAFAIVKDAREKARRREARVAEACRARETEAERALIVRARALEALYQVAHASLTAQLEATLDSALAGALASIGASVPAQQRLPIVCEQLKSAAGPLPGARLHLCEADAPRYRAAYRVYPWPPRIDDTLSPGQCKLTTGDGEWALDFAELIVALSAATAPRVASSVEPDDA